MPTAKNKSVTLLIIAAVFGLIGSLLAMLYLNARESSLRELLEPKSQPIAVVVASQDLVKGDILNGSSLAVREIPSDFVDTNAVYPADFEQIEGLVLQQNLASGKVLLHSFVAKDFPRDFSDTIELKRRAMTIQIDETNTFTGLLRPGNRIDLMVKMAAGKNADSGKKIIPVLENLEILTTGRDSAQDYEEKVRILKGGGGNLVEQNFTTITVNVTTKQAAILSLAQDQGVLVALLRNRKDPSGLGFSQVGQDDVKQHAQVLLQQEQARKAYNQLAMSIVRGGDGVLRDKNGKPLANQDLILASDGSLRTKSGINLSSRGLSLNSQGEIVDRDGNVVNTKTLSVGKDGRLRTADGRVLAGAKVKTLAGVKKLADGRLVLADGTILNNASLDKDGNIVLADGSVHKPNELVVSPDGSVRTLSGEKLAGVTAAKPLGKIKQLADGSLMTADGQVLVGAKLDADGNVVLANGEVVNPNDLVIAADGSIQSSSGQQLAGVSLAKPLGKLKQRADGTVVTADGKVLVGARLNKDGQLVLADGTVVDPSDVVINADGSISDKSGQVIAGVGLAKPLGKLNTNADGDLIMADGTVVKGAKLNEDGMLVLADGSVVDPSDVVISADGVVQTKDGQVLAGVSAKKPLGMLSENADGSIVLADGTVIPGAKLNAQGQLVLADGSVVDPSDVIIRSDGSVATKSGQILLDANERVAAGGRSYQQLTVDFIVGGVSKDGVLTVNKVPRER